jgi:hypothetical protein
MMKPTHTQTSHTTTLVDTPQTSTDDSVKLSEIFSVGLGAILIVLFAIFELANQFFTKIKNPEEAESIVTQVVQYQMPGGAQGLKSFKTNTEAFALVGNRHNPPTVLLLVSKAPIEKRTGEVPINLVEELDVPTALVGTWQKYQTTVENRRFCDKVVPVTIRKGAYRLIESPRKLVPMQEYMIVQSQKQTEQRIQLFGVGTEGAQQLDAIFRSFKCPQPE